MKKILFLAALLFSFFLTNITFAHNLNERFIIMGHLYPILDDDERYQKFDFQHKRNIIQQLNVGPFFGGLFGAASARGPLNGFRIGGRPPPAEAARP